MENIQKLEKAITVSKGEERIRLQLELAYELRQINSARSMSLSQKAHEVAIELGDSELELKALVGICTTALYHEKFAEKELWLQKLEDRSSELKNNRQLAKAQIIRYRWASRDGDIILAAGFLTSALKLLNPEKDRVEIASSLTGLGNIHFSLRDYDKALDYYKSALPFVDSKMSDLNNLIKLNIAVIHTSDGRYREAWQDYQGLLDIVDDEDIVTLRLVNLNLGDLCVKTKEFNEALHYFEEALQLSRELDSNRELVYPLLNYAGVFLETGQYDQAREAYEEAEEVALKTGSTDYLLSAYDGMILFLKSVKEYPELVRYQDRKINLLEENKSKQEQYSIEFLEKDESIRELLNKDIKTENRPKENKEIRNLLGNILHRNQDLEVRLRNAITTIQEKDNVIAAHHRLATVGEMVSIIAHQWQQPLSIINAIIYSINDAFKYNELTEEYLNEKAKMVDQLVKYLANTLYEFRDFFKEQKAEQFRVSQAVKTALSLLSYALEKENVKIDTRIDNDFFLMGAPNELVQVFLNLINNARDAFLEDNTAMPLIQIHGFSEDNFHQISIFDNGGPVPDQLADTLFDQYVSTKGDKGTGLGLNICRTIIQDRFGGEIWHENTDNGVRFNIKFPIK